LQKVQLPIRFKEAVLILVPVALVIGLILMEPDLGTSFLIAFVSVTLLFVLGIDKKWIIVIGLAGLVLVGIVINSAEYRKDRVISYFNQILKPGSNNDSLKTAFQLEQAKIAVGSGGLHGVGFGNSLQKLFYIPQPHNDFIFSIIAEELGLVGTIAIWILYIFIFIKGMIIAKHFPNRYGSYLALGIVIMVIYQSLINISVVLGLMPTKGIPLPFISCGGSSMLMSLISVGILLNLSQHTRNA
jgi:cell division protein FtsW